MSQVPVLRLSGLLLFGTGTRPKLDRKIWTFKKYLIREFMVVGPDIVGIGETRNYWVPQRIENVDGEGNPSDQ